MTSLAPSQHRHAPGRGSRGRRPAGQRIGGRGYKVLAAVVLALSTGVSACSAPAPTVSSGPPAAGGAQTPDAQAPSAAPASAVAQSVTAALQALVASTPQPSTAQVRESLTAAGLDPAAVEVSASRTPTGLAADAVEVGVLDGSDCVVAQVRAGTVASSVLPVLSNGRCFVGSLQR